MNPDTHRFERLHALSDAGLLKEQQDAFERHLAATAAGGLLRPDGSPVPDHWKIFTVGEVVEVNGVSFRIQGIGESSLLLEPAGGLPIIGGTAKAQATKQRREKQQRKRRARKQGGRRG